LSERSEASGEQSPTSLGRIESSRAGVVESFVDESGLGTVKDETGRTFAFHCTSISDGSRTIAVGTPVEFVVAAGLKGQFEARRIVRR